MKFQKVLLYLLLSLSFILGILAVFSYYAAFKPNLKKEKQQYELKVYTNETEVALGLKFDSILLDTSSFVNMAAILNLKQLKPGRYVFNKGMNNIKIINKLKSGAQDPLNITINSIRDIHQLSSKLGDQLMFDSLAFLQVLTDSFKLNELGYTKENILSLFIPNTYEMYWSISPERLMKRMNAEHESFWNKNNRRAKAEQKAISLYDIYTIASIVDKETLLEHEKPIIAEVYINRLKSGMKLQADPTVVFALGSTGLQRVLFEHLKIESPYNTYLVEGLPPGPICMPQTSTIDSVLNATGHEYIFFCAKPGYDGAHSFAKSLEAHSQNARIYRQWLNKERIK